MSRGRTHLEIVCDSVAGTAYVYSGSSVASSWNYEARLQRTVGVSGECGPLVYMLGRQLASPGYHGRALMLGLCCAAGDLFGASVAISPDGMLAAIGAPNYYGTYQNQGAVYVFKVRYSGKSQTHICRPVRV